MNFQELKKKLVEAKEPQGSFEDPAPRQVDAVAQIRGDSFTEAQVLPVIRKHSSARITDSILEQYVGAASSKEFSTDPITLELIQSHGMKVGDKYLFVMENTVIGLSALAIGKIVEGRVDTLSIDSIKKIIEG